MKPKTHPTTILIVYDDELLRVSLGILVSSLGLQCMVASSGNEAIEILGKNRCDLVLTDISIPNLNGLELLKFIKEKHPDTDVILTPGSSKAVKFSDVINAGAIDFIKKPIDLSELEARIVRAVSQRQQICDLEFPSSRDDLTALLNRMAFDCWFPKELERSHRQNYGLFMTIIDINNFREFNDRCGRPHGDDILMSLGKIIREHTRKKVDLAFRIGGDEFALLLPQTNATEATEISQRILLGFVENNFNTVTLAMGIVSCRRDSVLPLDQDIRRLKQKAGKALLHAKICGSHCAFCKR